MKRQKIAQLDDSLTEHENISSLFYMFFKIQKVPNKLCNLHPNWLVYVSAILCNYNWSTNVSMCLSREYSQGVMNSSK